MGDLIEFLRARLAEDEEAAVAARRHSADHADVLLETMDVGTPGLVIAEHIARWDPARVLAEVAAKRTVLAEVLEYESSMDHETGCCHRASEIEQGKCAPVAEIMALLAMARPYARHPDFDPAWRVQ